MADSVTPLMQQYRTIKDAHPDEVLFFRLGDFYEMFDEDAVQVSRLLNLTLTHRAGRQMCGVPFHASKIYIARLLRLGKKVAVCEQVSQPGGRGLADRQVVEVITPGTVSEDAYLDQGVNNYLAALYCSGGKTGFAYLDVTTAEFAATSWKDAAFEEAFAREMGRILPREILLPQSLQQNVAVSRVLSLYAGITVSWFPDWKFSQDISYKRLTEQFCTLNLRSFSLENSSPEIAPAGFLLEYLALSSGSSLPHIRSIRIYRDEQQLIIDDSSRRNLEITANLHDGGNKYSLLETVSHTVTAMGSRLLRRWLMAPLIDPEQIRSRQDDVERFVHDEGLLRRLQGLLKSVLDVERLAARLAMDRAHAKDLQALRTSLAAWVQAAQEEGAVSAGPASFDIDTACDIIRLISDAVCEDPSTVLHEGRLIKRGWSEALDRLHELHENCNAILNAYADEERSATGIANLKIKYNHLLGYYIEVTKGKLDAVPSHFILRRTMVNGDRYTTERLQALEAELNSADEHIVETERELFLEVRDRVKQHTDYLMRAAAEIAYADVCAGLARAAIDHRWCRPLIKDGGVFRVVQGRHPVVELHLKSGEFVPNDMDFSSASFALITGPNMAGKSTFLRQNALIALLAQIGSFVPAREAELGIVDRIFCRVGAADNLARGESTFLVEMTETAHILRSATKRSLVIMDEVGRGTSTEDGLSIAWAVSEYLLNKTGCKTLFATHYHELSRLSHPALTQLCLEVREQDDQVLFLKKIRPGVVENSFGIHVARLAGVPDSVIRRAASILNSMHGEGEKKTPAETAGADFFTDDAGKQGEKGLFPAEELVLDEILSLDPDAITPLQALQAISRWKKSLYEG